MARLLPVDLSAGGKAARQTYQEYLRNPHTTWGGSRTQWLSLRRELISQCPFCGQGRRHETLLAAARHRDHLRRYHVCPRGDRWKTGARSVLRLAGVVR